MEPLTILAALAPAAIDGIKAIIAKFTGNKPTITSAEDYAKVLDAEIRKLEALARMDAPAGEVSRWVNNVRAMQRPTFVGIIMLAWAVGALGTMAEDKFLMVANLASAAAFYLLGDRTMLYFRR